MIAGKSRNRSTNHAWPEPSKEILTRWSTRHPAYLTYSSHYMMAQRRILFLADVHPSKRFEAFEEICLNRQLAPTTAESYWTTWLGIQKALNITPSEADRRTTRVLKARAVAYPVKFPTPASLNDMELLVATFDTPLPSFAAIACAASFSDSGFPISGWRSTARSVPRMCPSCRRATP